MNKIVKAFKILITKGPVGVIEKIQSKINQNKQNLSTNQRYQIWFNKNYPNKLELKKQKSESGKFKYRPKISIITPVYNTSEKFLRECIESVINQTYDNWELCLADDASTKPYVKKILEEYKQKDKRIKIVFRKTNGHICKASNDALKLATGEFIALLDHDDILWPNALFEAVKLINTKPHTQFIYSDEDKLEEDSKTHVDPFFKPDWSPDYLRSINYITHFTIIKKDLVDKVGGFRPGFEGAQDWDLFLRCARELKNESFEIQHLSKILYSWRKSSESTASEKYIQKVKSYAYPSQKKSLEDDLEKRGYVGKVFPTEYLGLWRIKYNIIDNPLVSIIIPTKDQYQYISKCLSSILKKTTYTNYEIIIVDTGSTDKKVWELYDRIKQQYNKTNVLTLNGEFNFAKVCNFGTKESRGEYLLFLNNDTEIVSTDWIEGLLEHAQRKEVGVVGCKLLYPNNRIQHAGVIFNPKNKLDRIILPDHAFKGYRNGYDYTINNSRIYGVSNYIALTGACLMIEKKKFLKVGQFDEKLKIAFNDVDLCLKLFKQGYFNVFTPFSVLIHHESVSTKKPSDPGRNQKQFKKELGLLYKKWSLLINDDPYFNSLYN